MPKLVRLTARVDLTCAGRPIAAGETFEARPLDAAILIQTKKAAFAKRAEPVGTPMQTKDQAAEEPAEPRRRRQYRRRDLVAEG